MMLTGSAVMAILERLSPTPWWPAADLVRGNGRRAS